VGTHPASAPRPTPSEKALERTIVAATLVGACLRLFRLGHQSLWIDEQFTLAAAGLPGRIAWRDLLDNVHGPLHTLCVALAASLGGPSEWVLRLPSALAGIALVPAMAWLAARWTGRETAAPAAWLAAGSPFLVWYSQECRNYAFLILASVLATGALLDLHRRTTPAGVLRYLAAAAAGALSNLSFALLLPFHLRLWLAAGPSRRARLVALGVVAGALALVALPWLPAIRGIWDWSRLSPSRATPVGEVALRGAGAFHVAAVPFALHAFAMGYSGGPSLRELRAGPVAAVRAHVPELALAGIVFGALGLLGLRALARRRRLIEAGLWLVAPALAVSYFAAHNFKVFHPRYLAVSMPCLLLGVAAAFADMGPRARRGWGLAVALLWAGSLARADFEAKYGREDYKGALAVLRRNYVPGEVVLAVGAPDPVEWYGRGLNVKRLWLGYANTPLRMLQVMGDSTRGAKGCWVVLSRPEDLDPTGKFQKLVLDSETVRESNAADTWWFSGVRVTRLWRNPDTTIAAPAPAPMRF
jgi:4-amino-4-deoxy-L-arabinose transferase-like glycosyltransferase